MGASARHAHNQMRVSYQLQARMRGLLLRGGLRSVLMGWQKVIDLRKESEALRVSMELCAQKMREVAMERDQSRCV